MDTFADFARFLQNMERTIKELVDKDEQKTRQIQALENALPEWVDQVEAERLTGLSETSLWRQRKNSDSLIEWKQDRGVRYLRASLIAYNNRRAVVRGTSPVVK